jgi:hypothetical protein
MLFFLFSLYIQIINNFLAKPFLNSKIQFQAYVQFKTKINEAEVKRRTFGKKLKHTVLNYAIGDKLDQRPEFWKNLVTTLSSRFYEFGTTRYKGRNKKPKSSKTPKYEVKKEEYSVDEESYELSVETVGDDDEDYTPQSESRKTRSTLKLSDQKTQAKYAAAAESRDSNFSVYSSGSVARGKRKEVYMEDLVKSEKRKKNISPMHLTSSISATKVAVAPQTILPTPTNPTPIDKDFLMDMFATYKNTMNKKIEDIIEKKLVKMDKKEKIQQEKDDENKDEEEDLVEDDVQNI